MENIKKVIQKQQAYELRKSLHHLEKHPAVMTNFPLPEQHIASMLQEKKKQKRKRILQILAASLLSILFIILEWLLLFGMFLPD